jgi:predicted PilT family ATPase
LDLRKNTPDILMAENDAFTARLTLPVPTTCLGYIIGKEGKVRKQIETQNKVRINIPPREKQNRANGMVEIVIEGHGREISYAEEEIKRIIRKTIDHETVHRPK